MPSSEKAIALAAAQSAAASAMTAAQAAEEAVAIVGVDTADDLITILDADAGSTFRTQQDARLSATYAALDGVRRSFRTPGDGLAGALDVDFKHSEGYGLHLTAGDTGAETGFRAVIGIGTDQGSATGLFISHKNAGSGIQITQHPGTGPALFVQGKSSGYTGYHEVYSGNQGILTTLKTGQGYTDGVTTNGSTTFTSATAAFTAGDVGAVLSQSAGGAAAIQDSIPAGTTIASVTNATTVVLSQPAVKSSTGVRFMVASRVPVATQKVHTWYDHDGTTLVEILRGSISTRRPLTARNVDAATVPLTILGQAAQTADLFGVIRSGDADNLVEVSSAGKLITRAGLAAQNAIGSTQVPLAVFNTSAAVDSVTINAASGQTADQLRFQSNGGTAQTRFDKDGRFGTRVNSAPADAAVATGEVVFWFDSTTGAAKVMFKAKDAGGTVRTGSVALA